MKSDNENKTNKNENTYRKESDTIEENYRENSSQRYTILILLSISNVKI